MKSNFPMSVLLSMIILFMIKSGILYAQRSEPMDSLTVEMEWISVDGGSFRMGGTKYADERPIHTVSVSSFEMSKYEITNLQFCTFLNAEGVLPNGSHNFIEYIKIGNYSDSQIAYEKGRFIVQSGKDHYPAVGVTWFGARAFCNWAGGRLPTEAEWEYAARGGKQSKGYKYSGSDNNDAVAWNRSNSDGMSHPVGSKQPNEIGLYDMSGNVFEWCQDWYDDEYYAGSSEKNPEGPPSGTYRVIRGGSWLWNIESCQVEKRKELEPNRGTGSIGFRCVR